MQHSRIIVKLVDKGEQKEADFDVQLGRSQWIVNHLKMRPENINHERKLTVAVKQDDETPQEQQEEKKKNYASSGRKRKSEGMKKKKNSNQSLSILTFALPCS